MNQAIKATLLAQATSEVTTLLRSLVDFDAVKEESNMFIQMAASSLGAVASEFSIPTGQPFTDDDFLKLQQELVSHVDERAKAEVGEAVKEAEKEQAAHVLRLQSFRASQEQGVKKMKEISLPGPSQEAFGGFISLAGSSRDASVESLERMYEDVMKAVQRTHLMNLMYCFRSHVVSEETAKKLAELYEIK